MDEPRPKKLSPAEAKAILDQMRLQGAYLQAKPGLEVAYGFNKVVKALEIIEQIEAAGRSVSSHAGARIVGKFRQGFVGFQDSPLPDHQRQVARVVVLNVLHR